MKEDQKIEKTEDKQKPITHIAIPVENLKNLFDFLKTIKGVSFPDGQAILDIVRKDNISLTMAKGDDDIISPPPIGQGDKKEE